MRAVIGIIAALWAGIATAQDRAGVFDYYVMALSWSPSWCAATGDERGAPQCDPEADTGWVLHGLWPQYEQGYPEYCSTTARDPSRRETAAMGDLFGDGGAAWYQWKKHGRCAGLSSRDYFDLAREAFDSIEKPAVLRRVTEALRLRPQVIEQAFLEVNPQLEPDMITLTCRSGRIAEARVCLTRDLEPRYCSADVVRDCTRTSTFPPIR
ncbi:ribonuclease T2 [Rubricella aquisinus]|uniref:Ribonuclease T2 n=1 Tax=Rubricella aquisinus TaxID=2028108 RepID=A0A840WP82_9RHOB|nr:ribonuclease T2 [Rubricella aquisinus]MBB5516859.1 ribonuclease T2 [Rubricella aquisinus]